MIECPNCNHKFPWARKKHLPSNDSNWKLSLCGQVNNEKFIVKEGEPATCERCLKKQRMDFLRNQK